MNPQSVPLYLLFGVPFRPATQVCDSVIRCPLKNAEPSKAHPCALGDETYSDPKHREIASPDALHITISVSHIFELAPNKRSFKII